MTLWLLAAGLLVAAALFVAVPLVFPASARRGPALRGSGRNAAALTDPEVRSDAVVRALYRDRVAELEAEAAAGRLDPEVRQQVLDELGASLLDDYREFEAAGAGAALPQSGRANRLGWVLALLLPLAGIGVYWLIGEPTAGSVAGGSAALQLDPEQDRAALEAWRERFEQRVALEPDDAQSWYLLGNVSLQLADFGPAAEAFGRAAEITGPDPVVDVSWLQARYLAHGGAIDPRTREIAERILERRSNHPLVLELYAIDAYRREAYREAVGYLNRALSNELPEPQLNALLTGLEQARARMGPLLPSVAVAVTAAPDAPREAVLFVIARPPGGGMPYAVLRRPASHLPLTVYLDDTASMNPDVPLSRAANFEVVVRLSRSGMPAAQPGDWEWRSATLDTGDFAAPVQLTALLEAPAAGAVAEPAPIAGGARAADLPGT